jgi:hypothetical protein
MARKKLTLSVRGDLLDEIKKLATIEGRSLSSIFEYMVFGRWVEALSRELDLGSLEPKNEFEVPRSRPKGLDAAGMVRKLRRRGY